MLSRVLPFVAAVFFAPPAPVGTPSPPPGWTPPAPPAADQILWGAGDASVLDVTAKVKQDLEARPGHEKLRIVLRHGGNDAQLAKLVTMLPWVEQLVIGEPALVTSLAPVAKLTKLHMLHVNSNKVTTLAPLATHPSLEHLVMTCSPSFADKDLMALDGVTTLQTIDLRGCSNMTDLHGLEKLTNLTSVSTYGTPITSVAALTGHAKIRALSLHGNAVADLGPLAGMPELAILNLEGATATSFDALKGLTKLHAVDLARTSIKSFDVLAASPDLWSLGARDAKALTLAKLPTWPKLTMLTIDGTSASDLTPVAKLTALTYLSFDRTPVKSITPIMGMPNLKSVTMPAVISDAEVIALEKAHPGIGILRFGKPLPGRPPPMPIP